MDLNSIEATSVAIRVGQVAAAELCNLLTHEDEDVQSPIEDWFDPQQGDQLPTREFIEALGITVDKLGGYVCYSPDPVSGERLYRWAVQERLVGRGQWADLPFGRRQAFEVFAAATRGAYTPLKAEQARLAAIGAEAPHQLGLALEDSIFEPDEPFDKLIEGGEAMLKVMETASFTPVPRDELVAAATGTLQMKPPAAPLSIGEAPVKTPKNPGGRPPRPKRT